MNEELLRQLNDLQRRVEFLESVEHLDTSRIRTSSVGGLTGSVVVRLTNKTGGASIQGRLLRPDTATDDAVIYTDQDCDECIGVFLKSGIADGAEAWVVVAGIADVAFDDNHGPTRGDWVGASEAGYSISQASPAAAPAHFREMGHCIETVAAGGGGTHVTARCVLHFL